MAAEFAARRGQDGVEIMTADARSTGLATGSFDLVHARTLLINLPSPRPCPWPLRWCDWPGRRLGDVRGVRR